MSMTSLRFNDQSHVSGQQTCGGLSSGPPLQDLLVLRHLQLAEMSPYECSPQLMIHSSLQWPAGIQMCMHL